MSARPHERRNGQRAQCVQAPLMPVGHYRFEFRALDPIDLPVYAGSAWRGVFGHALKRTVCVTREPECARCLLFRSCAYSYVFETPPPADTERMRLYTAAPHPFVLAPAWGEPRHVQPDETFELPVRLFGRANAHLPYIVHALQSAGHQGLGRGRGRYELARLEQASSHETRSWSPIYAGETLHPLPVDVACDAPPRPDSLRIRLQTPLRLKQQSDLCAPEAFEFHHLFGSLLRRISMLMYFHAGTELAVDFRGLMDLAREVRLAQRELRWREWTRYSSRQRTAMQMGGITGHIEIDGQGLDPFWSFLWHGQSTHAGKGASMGLGRYEIDAASLPVRTTDVEKREDGPEPIAYVASLPAQRGATATR